MLRAPPERPLVLVLDSPSRVGASIHTFFMRFAIDVYWLDESRRVVDKARLEPWAVNATPRKAAKFVLEAPAGRVSLRIGEKVGFG
jgi:uncharacterized membrane protein (UPF0127 family)